MRFRSEEKGNSETRGNLLLHWSCSIPPFPAKATKAPSVGSPKTIHSPCCCCRTASLQTAHETSMAEISGTSSKLAFSPCN